MVETDRENTYVFFADQATAEGSRFPEKVALEVVATSAAATAAASASGRRSLRDMWALSRQVLRHDLDLFFFPAVYTYFPIFNRTKVVVTLHDVIADRNPQATFPNKKLMYFWKAKQRLALFQADRLLTVSEYSRRTICDYFSLPGNRVSVTTESASSVFRPLLPEELRVDVLEHVCLSPGDRFMLYVGGISPHKNLGALIDAYHILVQDPDLSDVRLILVGDYKGDSFHSDYPRLKAQIDRLGLESRVTFAGYVPDDDLVHLYNAALLLVFPSLEEGFGLPAVEAMQCGTPVVASDRGSLPEILGPAGRFFDPVRPESIHEALRDVVRDEDVRATMRQRGLERMASFTWQEAARKTLCVFNELGRA